MRDPGELEKGDKQSKGTQPFHNCSVVEGLLSFVRSFILMLTREELAIHILQTQSNLKTIH